MGLSIFNPPMVIVLWDSSTRLWQPNFWSDKHVAMFDFYEGHAASNKWIRVSNGEIHTFWMRIFRIRISTILEVWSAIEMVKFPVFMAVKLQFQWSNPHFLDVKSTLLMIQSLILVQSIVPMVKSIFGRSIHILPSTAAFPPRLDGALQPRRP